MFVSPVAGTPLARVAQVTRAPTNAMKPRTRLAAMAVAVAVVMVAGAAFAVNWTPTVPPEAPTTLVARTALAGPMTPDASPDVDPGTLPSSPSGQGCLKPIERPAGMLDLCWEAHREPGDANPNADYYTLRVYGTFGGESGSGVRWLAVAARLVGSPVDRVFQGWPDGQFDGPCRTVDVGFGAVPAQETVCGRTVGRTNSSDWSQTATWNCVGCLIGDHGTRSIALHEFVAVPERSVPTWEIRSDFGS